MRSAAQLNCYGEAFAEMRERAQAELDAAAFCAYGLDREQTGFVLGGFSPGAESPPDDGGIFRVGPGEIR